MKISANSAYLSPPATLQKASRPREAAGGSGLDFAEGLDNALGKLGELQTNADELITKMATGQVDDINKVVIAVEKANIAMQLGVQVRNKVVEAYQEIMHMQV